jgi:large subunit ribosomal protein L18
MKTNNIKLRRTLRQRRVRAVIKGTALRPRLCVSISLKHISAQLINDDKAVSLTSFTTVGRDIKGTMTDKAIYVGQEIAKQAKKVKVTKVVLDRGHKLYHGRIKALADAARAGGLEF